MKTLIRYCFAVLLMAMVFITTSPTPVYACSGGAPMTLKGLINNSTYVVKAHVAEADDAQQNIILHVDSYLAGGSGPTYLLLMRNDPVFINYILAGRSSGGDCLGLFQTAYPDQTMYLFLYRTDNGSYTVVTTLFNAYSYVFPTPDATVEVFLKGGLENGGTVYEDLSEKDGGQKVSEQEFVKLIAQESGEKPSKPNTGEYYPLKAPLRLTTTSGKQYVLPIDGQSPFELTEEILKTQERNYPLQSYGFYEAGRCEPVGCKSISPDGLNIAVQTNTDKITMSQGYEIAGQASLFSSTSDSIAVWNKCQLTVYTTGYPRLLEEWYQVKELQHTKLNGDKDCMAFSKLAAWGSNGRLLAYSDEKGLWLWDTFNLTAQPRLLIAASDQVIPMARKFSPLDGYLSVIEGTKRYIIDLASQTKLPDGLFSADDRLLLKFDTATSIFDLEICAVVPYNCQPINHMYISVFDASGENFTLYDDLSQVNKVEWINQNTFVVLACVPEDQMICAIFRWSPSFYGWDRSSLFEQAKTFAYEPTNETLAILKDEKTVVIDNQTYDLSDVTDSEIVNIEWLPSLFYRN